MKNEHGTTWHDNQMFSCSLTLNVYTEKYIGILFSYLTPKKKNQRTKYLKITALKEFIKY